ncbi:MAG: hypothetical protein U0800_26330 [Isosphaeraceae bacterium]
MSAPQPIPPRGDEAPVVRPDALNGLPDRPLGEFVNRFEPPASPNDIAMADDPSTAGAQAIFHLSRPLEGLSTRNGPLRPDGTDPTQNATSHGCTAKTIHVSEVGHYREIQGHLYAEHRPESNDEAACVDRMATARFMGEKCDRAIQSQAINAIDKHKAERRKPLEAEIVRLETSLRIWERAQARKIVFGKGFGDAYPTLLKDVDPASRGKEMKDPAAREFSYLHSNAIAEPRLMELHRKFSRDAGADRSSPEFREYRMGLDALEEDLKHLLGWVQKHVMNLRNLLEKAQRDLITVDTAPVDKDVLLFLSDEYRKLHRYRKEYESSYYRNLKGFKAIRGNLMVSYDREMHAVQKKYPVMFRVGPLGIHLPNELSRLCPYDQIDAMIRILHREQRYYDRDSRNAAREAAAMAKPYETETFSDATWNGVDCDGRGNKRVIGGESTLQPPIGAPRPPDEPDLPR